MTLVKWIIIKAMASQTELQVTLGGSRNIEVSLIMRYWHIRSLFSNINNTKFSSIAQKTDYMKCYNSTS